MGTRVRVVTTCQVDDSKGRMADLAAAAMALKPDILCLPECFSRLGIRNTREYEPVPGPTTQVFMRMAKEHGCYLVCPLKTLRGGHRRNSAVLIDRSGEIAGVYDKAHPVTTMHDYTEFEGVTPGESAPTFDLDFGRVGIQICFDVGFPESWAELSDNGARLVFWPSAYAGGFPLQAYAYLHHYYVVSAVRTDRSRIIDPCGAIVAQTTARQQIAYYDLSLDFTVAHYDFNYGIPGEIQARYGDRVRLRSCVDEGCFLVEAVDDSVTIGQLQKELGFESIQQYHDRHRDGYASIVAGRKPVGQKAAHGRRPQYSA